MIKKWIKNPFKRPKGLKETPLEFIASLISCWLITIGTCIILDSFFYMQIGVSAIVKQTLFTVVFVALITRRWWIPLVMVGITVPLILLAAYYSDAVYYILGYLGDFFEWWFSMLPMDSMWHSEIGFTLVHTIINFGVTIFFFAITRITKSPWLAVIVAVGVLVLAYAFGYINYDFWAIPFLVAGIFPFIASNGFRNKNLPNIKALFGMLGEKWFFAIVTTFVAVVICLSSVTVVFTMDGSVRTRFFTDVVSDIQSTTKLYTNEQKRLQISLYDMGLATDRKYVGGEIRNFGSAVLAVTDLTEPAYIKITAYDNFDGKNWNNTFENSYRVDGPWENKEEKYLSTTLLNDSYYKKVVNTIARTKRVNVYMNYDSHIFPVIGQAYNFEELTPNKNQIQFDKSGRLFSYYGQEKGFTYSFDTVIYNSKQEVLKEQLKKIIPVYGNSADPLYDPEGDFYKTFTQQYEDRPEEIDQIIGSFGFVVDNYYDKAYKICEFFSKKNGFVYTDTPPQFNEGDDIVRKLFETKQGHCVYYSTAMIALTRAAGIPSRLAAGYRSVKSPITNTQVVDRAHPYTWVECYIPHIGWVNFDPTPQVKAVPMVDPDAVGDLSINGVDTEESEEETHKTPGTVLEWDGGPNIPLLVTAPIVAVIFVLLLINTVFSKSFYKLKVVKKRFKDTKQQAEYYYRDMIRQFGWLGFKLKKGETITELTLRTRLALDENYAKKISDAIIAVEGLHYGKSLPNVCAQQPVIEAREELEKALAERNSKAFFVISDGIKVIEAMHYGGITPTDEQILTIFNAHEALEKELKLKNNVFVYILKRRLLLPIFNFSFRRKGKK